MTERIRTLVVDDEPLARRRLLSMLAKESEIEVIAEAGSGTAAVRAITEERPDLVFLDVQMPGLNGFEVLRATASKHQPLVIFVTAHDEHAIRAFDVQAIDYLLKPVDEARFREAVRRAVARLRQPAQRDLAREMAQLLDRVSAQTTKDARIPVKRDGRVSFVPIDEIDWVEADGDLVRLHTAKGAHVIRETMAQLETKLSAPDFVRIHRSIIVNARRVREVQPWFKGDYVLTLNDGTKLRSGRTYRQSIQSLIR
jgi:two-component system, LytTR family, response regulator